MDLDLIVAIAGAAVGLPSFVLGLVVDRHARRVREQQHWRMLRAAIDKLQREAKWYAATAEREIARFGRNKPWDRKQVQLAGQAMHRAREELFRAFDDSLTPSTLRYDTRLSPPNRMEPPMVPSMLKWVAEGLEPALAEGAEDLSRRLGTRRK